MRMSFEEFRKGPSGSVFAGLGDNWRDVLSDASSFEDLRDAIVNYNDRDVGRFVHAVRRYACKCSSGEFRLLLAIAAFADFGHLSDELAAGAAWQDVTRGCDRRFREAIAACVMEAP